jgi:peptidoglycan-associated lipoprotein
MRKILITLFIYIISTQLLVAQNLRKANHLFEKRAYVAATELFLNQTDKTQEVLEKLGDCYYYNSNMEEASKWYGVLFSEYENTTTSAYVFRYTQALKGKKKYAEADKLFEKYNEGIKVNTLGLFEALNASIERPYIIHTVSENTNGSDFGTSFYGDKIVFASTRSIGEAYDWNDQPYLDLYIAEVDNQDNLTNVSSLSNTINTKVHEANAVFTKDGNTMYFTRNNYHDGKKKRDENKISHLKIYSAKKVNGSWINIKELSFNSDNYSVSHPTLSKDESQLYFSSDMPGTLGSFDIFVVERNENGTYGTPKNLGSTINTEQREQFPFVSKNNTLYFASDGHLGLGGLDIFKSTMRDGNYSSPKNLSDKINSNLDDFAFIIDETSETGYFSSNRKGGKGDDDIYRFTQLKTHYVQGLVQDKNSLDLLPGSMVTLFDQNNNNIADTIVGTNAAFKFKLESNKKYTIKGTRKLYLPYEVIFSTNNKGNTSKNITLLFESYKDIEDKIVVEDGKTQIKINSIYFDFAKWNIRSDAAIELNNVLSIMKKYPNLIIEIGAHTDCRGEKAYNLDLSHKRANSVREYLISQGINNDNVKSVGYGEMQPKNHCITGGICTDEEYNINRRCEFVILN